MNLTPTQIQVLELLANEGLSRQAIADRLGSSPETIRTHVTAITRRTGTHSALQAAVWAWQHGYVWVADGTRAVVIVQEDA